MYSYFGLFRCRNDSSLSSLLVGDDERQIVDERESLKEKDHTVGDH